MLDRREIDGQRFDSADDPQTWDCAEEMRDEIATSVAFFAPGVKYHPTFMPKTRDRGAEGFETSAYLEMPDGSLWALEIRQMQRLEDGSIIPAFNEPEPINPAKRAIGSILVECATAQALEDGELRRKLNTIYLIAQSAFTA